jgi:hypothetical protein
MRIGLEDIDPQIAQAVEERLAAPVHEFLKEDIYWGGLMPWRLNWAFHSGKLQIKRKREPTEDEKAAYDLRKKREEQIGWRAVTSVFGPVGLGSAVIALSTAGQEPSTAGILSGIATWLAGTGVGVWWTLRATPKASLRRAVLVSEMKAVFPLLSLTRAERIYCDALLLLTRTEADTSTEQTLRETLKQLNTLLKSHRQVEARRASLLPIMGMNAIPELEAEYGALGRRLDQATDTVTRQSLQQSLQMCANRLENARNLTQSLERLNVQQEAIIQTLSSTLSAMARMQVAPDTQTALVAEEIAATISEMNQRTYAVEQAVEEVITLRTQG